MLVMVTTTLFRKQLKYREKKSLTIEGNFSDARLALALDNPSIEARLV